jgi:hypothetical protein
LDQLVSKHEPNFRKNGYSQVTAALTLIQIKTRDRRTFTREALFGIEAAVLLLLFTGIHNAWDAVVYHVLVDKRNTKD